MKLSYDKVSMPTPTSTSNPGDLVSDQFPAGLRVLVVDDDPTCLIILERMLSFCLYKVTKCNQAEEALSLLRENKNGFDIVLSDVHMPDMDGFKLLEHIGLEMDLPVIMMSVDDGKNVVMKGVKHGACDYLIKPVRIEALKNIWQHVVRKRKNLWKDLKQSRGLDEGDHREQKVSDDANYSSSANEGKSSRKRRDEEDEIDEKDNSSTSKKPRVVWSVELHQQFMAVVDQLGLDKAVPKKIMEMMNVSGLTRENVASHLQKYRMYLRRMSGVSHQQSILNNSFMSPQEQHFRNFKPANFLHGTPTNMEPKQFANLHQSAQSFGSTSTRVNASAAQRSSPWLRQMAQSQPRVQMLNENTDSHATRFPSYLVQPTGPNGIANGVVGNGVADNSAAQRSSLFSFPMNQTTEISVSNFPLRCTPGISSFSTKGVFHAEASGSKGSSGFLPSYYNFNFNDASQHANPLQIDVSPSIIGRVFSNIQQTGRNRDATSIGKALISNDDGMSHGHLQNIVENSSMVKSQKVHDPISEINPFFDQFDQEDLMSAFLKQHEGVGPVQKEFDFDGYSIDNIPVYNRSC